MFNFNEEAVRKEHENGVGIIAKTQEVVDQICKEGFKNIFYIGIGGTILYAGQMEHIVKEAGSTIPLILENAADFNWVGNPHFGKDSIVAIASISGDTKEVVEAVDKAHEVGAKVIGYVEKEGSPLYEKCDYVISTVGGEYYFWYTVTLRFMANAGQFPKYDQFMKEIVNMPENVVNIYKKSDEKAKEFADKYCDSPLTYLVGSGYLLWYVYYGRNAVDAHKTDFSCKLLPWNSGSDRKRYSGDSDQGRRQDQTGNGSCGKICKYDQCKCYSI